MMGGMSGTKSASGTMTIQTVAGDANSMRTVPVNLENCRLALRVMSAGTTTSDCTCTTGDTPGATASNGFQLKSTGSATGDVVNDAAQLWILQNIKNPYTMTFAQNFTQSFLTSYVQGQKQREAVEESIRQQQEQQAEQAREAEQQRINAMFARLNSELKLSGIDTQLQLKTGDDPTQLAMKLSGSGSDALAFKLGDTPSSAAAALPPDPASETGGLKLKLGDEPPAGSATAFDATISTSPASTMGIPGLPGIYLNNVPPAQAPQVAAAALSMNGPERDIAEDTALQAAQKNPALTTPSDDPFVQDYQEQAREYADVVKEQQAALDKAAEAQGHVQADQTALNYASGIGQAPGATGQQLQALAQLQAAASNDEEMAATARVGFDTAGAQATVKREEATISLAVLAPPPPTTDAPLRDAIAASPATQPSGSTPFFGSPAAKPAAPRPQSVNPVQTGPVQAANGLPVLSPTAKPQIFPPQQPGGKPAFAFENVQQCLAQTAPAAQPNPSLEQLKQQLEGANRAYDQLLKSMEEQSEEWREWQERWQKAGRDSVLHLFDDTVDSQLEGAVETAKEPINEEAAGVKKQLDAVVEEYRDYHYAMAETYPMSGVTTQGAVIFTPDQLEQYKMLSMADFKAKLIPLNSQRMALAGQLAEIDQEKKRADLLLFAIRQGRDQTVKKIEESGEKNGPEATKNGSAEAPLSATNGLLNWLQKDESGAELHEFLDFSFAAAKYTGVGVPIAEGGKLALEMIDLSYDLDVESQAFKVMKKTDQNNAKFSQAQLSLQKRIARLTAETSCYYHSGAGSNPEAAR